ncbi:hypothetical protein [Flavobacterium flavigenum]|uniref:hypothetical protein n=1 Tax=Flavobacterium flavigenum TaxID=3003258 RepID=UPI0022ABC815|nr:hypothetical protein [Flavobacterium flavigenum]
MVEKNYDPDNDNCPEKDTIENLYLQKQSEKNKNIQTVEEFINDRPNRTSKKDNSNHTVSDYYEEKSNN